MSARLGLRTAALGYLALLLVAPVAMVFYRAFAPGLDQAWQSVTTPEAQHAFWLTIMIAGIDRLAAATLGRPSILHPRRDST